MLKEKREKKNPQEVLLNLSVKNLTALPQISLTLRKLNVKGNRITDISPLQNCLNMTWLELSNNLIEDLSPLENLKLLTTLNIGYNQITSLEVIPNLTQLRALVANSNQITEIPPNLPRYLNTIILAHNQLTVLTNLNHLFTLRKFSASYNQITAILNAFDGCLKLQEVNLRNNLIFRLPSLLNENVKLKILDLSNNRIESQEGLKVILEMDSLKDVSIEGNPLLTTEEGENWVHINLPVRKKKKGKSRGRIFEDEEENMTDRKKKNAKGGVKRI